MIIEIVISEIDFRVKENIRSARIKAGIDQVTLAQKIGVSEGYIGGIENPKNPAKANVRLISRIASALNLSTYNDILPEKVLKNDMVRLKIELYNINKRSQILDKNGNVPERLKELSKTVLTDDEYNLFKENNGKYCTIVNP